MFFFLELQMKNHSKTKCAIHFLPVERLGWKPKDKDTAMMFLKTKIKHHQCWPLWTRLYEHLHYFCKTKKTTTTSQLSYYYLKSGAKIPNTPKKLLALCLIIFLSKQQGIIITGIGGNHHLSSDDSKLLNTSQNFLFLKFHKSLNWLQWVKIFLSDVVIVNVPKQNRKYSKSCQDNVA